MWFPWWIKKESNDLLTSFKSCYFSMHPRTPFGHFGSTVPDISAPPSFQCPVRTVLPDWFCQKLIKNAKIPSKIVKIWLFLWNPNLVALKPQLPETGSWGFSATRYGFHKIAKSWLFYWGFWHFWEIFGKTTSGNTVRTGHQNNWDGLMSVIVILCQ